MIMSWPIKTRCCCHCCHFIVLLERSKVVHQSALKVPSLPVLSRCLVLEGETCVCYASAMSRGAELRNRQTWRQMGGGQVLNVVLRSSFLMRKRCCFLQNGCFAACSLHPARCSTHRPALLRTEACYPRRLLIGRILTSGQRLALELLKDAQEFQRRTFHVVDIHCKFSFL